MSHPDDRLLDQALAAARAEAAAVPDQHLLAATARVRERLGFAEPVAKPSPSVLGCAEVQQLLVARQRGELSPERATLMADHVRDCFACRRAERDLREATLRRPAVAAGRSWNWMRSAVAATLVGALAAGVWFVRRDALTAGELELVAGRILVPATGELLGAGATVATGAMLRTPPGESAMLRLADGSRIELDQRSSLAVEQRANGTTLRLDRGRLIVEAAKQKGGERLQVRTQDSLVTVVGTVFSVNSGLKGSRVGVLEGSVRVGHGGSDTVLGPGEQVVSNVRLEKVALAEEVAWSRDPERYLALLRELVALDVELAALGHDALRNAPSVGGAIPAGVEVYVALPNAAERLADSWMLAADRLSTNPALASWWDELESDGTVAQIDRALTLLADVGSTIGDEVVIVGSGGQVAALATVLDPRALATTLLDIPELTDGNHLTVVEGEALPAGDGPTLWIASDLVAVGERAILHRIAAARAGGASWHGSELHAAAIDRYQRGVETLVVAMAPMHEGAEPAVFVLEDRVEGSRHETRLAFEATGDGSLPAPIAWIATPAALGALELLSADTSAAFAFAIEDPRAAAQQLLELAGGRDSELAAQLIELRNTHGIDVIEDLAAGLGGEMAMALDGPVVPSPAWKLVVEVVDPSRLDWALERVVSELDRKLQAEGGQARITRTGTGGLEAHLVEVGHEGKAFSFVWAHLDGYLVFAPNLEAIARTAQNRATGYTLGRSARLRDALPVGSENGVSGLLWVDLRSAAGVFDLLATGLPPELRAEASQLLSGGEPLVGVILASPERLEVAGSRRHSPLGWLRLALLAGGFFGDRHGAA